MVLGLVAAAPDRRSISADRSVLWENAHWTVFYGLGFAIAFRGFRTSSGPERRIRAALASVSAVLAGRTGRLARPERARARHLPAAVRPRDVRGAGPRGRRAGPRGPTGGRSTRTARPLSRLRDHVPRHRDRRDAGLRAAGLRPRPARGDAAPQLPDRVPVDRRRRPHRGARHPRQPSPRRPLRPADRDVPLRRSDICSGWPRRQRPRRREPGGTTCSRSGRWPSAWPARPSALDSRTRRESTRFAMFFRDGLPAAAVAIAVGCLVVASSTADDNPFVRPLGWAVILVGGPAPGRARPRALGGRPRGRGGDDAPVRGGGAPPAADRADPGRHLHRRAAQRRHRALEPDLRQSAGDSSCCPTRRSS